jgi:hypothetical protein
MSDDFNSVFKRFQKHFDGVGRSSLVNLLSFRLTYLEPLEMQKTFTKRMLEQVVVSDLDKVDEHRTFTTSLIIKFMIQRIYGYYKMLQSDNN